MNIIKSKKTRQASKHFGISLKLVYTLFQVDSRNDDNDGRGDGGCVGGDDGNYDGDIKIILIIIYLPQAGASNRLSIRRDFFPGTYPNSSSCLYRSVLRAIWSVDP